MDAKRKAWLVIMGIVAAESTPLLILNHSWQRFARLIGIYPGSNHGTISGWVFAILVTLIYVFLTLRGLPFVRDHFFDIDPMKIGTLTLFAPVAAVFEELYFRKILMDTMANHGMGAFSQIAASAVAFGVAHAMWSLFAGQWRVGRNAAYATVALGALLAAVYLMSSRSLLPAIGAHFLINACIEPWLILAATSKSWGIIPVNRSVV